MKNKNKTFQSILPIACLAIQTSLLAQSPDPAPTPILRDGFGRPQQQLQLPNQITLPAGAWLSVRLNQGLSTKRNLPGDTFTASLAQPLVAEGIVLARRGQMVSGRVVEVQRAGRVKGTSRLGIELIEISLIDGQQLAVRTQLVETRAGTSNGRDTAAVAGTTATGAIIGAAAAGGSGAGLGAIAGAGASLIGVLATRGRDTEIFPEESLAFRTVAPLSISTERSAHAFQSVQQDDFTPAPSFQQRLTRPAFFNPNPWANNWGNYWGPGFFGPGPGFYYSPRFFANRGFGNRGFGRRW